MNVLGLPDDLTSQVCGLLDCNDLISLHHVNKEASICLPTLVFAKLRKELDEINKSIPNDFNEKFLRIDRVCKKAENYLREFFRPMCLRNDEGAFFAFNDTLWSYLDELYRMKTWVKRNLKLLEEAWED